MKALKLLIGLVFVQIAVVANVSAAWAPTMVDIEMAHLRSLGYEICDPIILQLPDKKEDEGALASAIPTPYAEHCILWFSDLIETSDLNWVAHHEVCHLATVNDIFADGVSDKMEDPAHQHPLFSACLDHGPIDRGGY